MSIESKIENYLCDEFQSEKYPELDKLATKIAKNIGDEINKEAIKIKSKMPYRERYVLEKIIRILEKAI